jgi:thiamine pyrophosphokinase
MKATLFADGEAVSPALRNLLRRGRFVVALDGAAERVRREGWKPNLVAGDFDSVRPATLRYFERRGVALLPTPDQNFTDLEKALAWCALRDFESIWIAGALGGRLDHSFSALSLLRRYFEPGRELVLFHGRDRVRFLRDEKVRLSGRAGRRIAVLPFPRCRARSRGLVYELTDTALDLGVRESVSNAARLATVALYVKGEALVVEEGDWRA